MGPGGKMCRPIILPDVNSDGEFIRKPMMQILGMHHPGLKLKNEKIKQHNIKTEYKNRIAVKHFVPNST
jgi:5S rRNA maturation endonuclease (ribonuclease M5)